MGRKKKETKNYESILRTGLTVGVSIIAGGILYTVRINPKFEPVLVQPAEYGILVGGAVIALSLIFSYIWNNKWSEWK